MKGKRTHRILQNVGGPCPLIGICNLLLLRNDIRINSNLSIIKFSDLTNGLKEHLHRLFARSLENASSEQETANGIQNIEDCVALFPQLEKVKKKMIGEKKIDLNIKFKDASEFEFTPQIAMFDNYSIRIYHGWVVDPQASFYINIYCTFVFLICVCKSIVMRHDYARTRLRDNASVGNEKLFKLIGHKSYNELVEYVSSEDYDKKLSDEEIQKLEAEKDVIRQYLNETPQQITAYGLIRLHELLQNGELAVFFHNNHFSTLYKRGDYLYTLVTDEGIVDADPRITWQTLTQMHGDEVFVGNDFRLLPMLKPQQPQPQVSQQPQPQVSQQPQQGQGQAQQPSQSQLTGHPSSTPSTQPSSDVALSANDVASTEPDAVPTSVAQVSNPPPSAVEEQSQPQPQLQPQPQPQPQSQSRPNAQEQHVDQVRSEHENANANKDKDKDKNDDEDVDERSMEDLEEKKTELTNEERTRGNTTDESEHPPQDVVDNAQPSRPAASRYIYNIHLTRIEMSLQIIDFFFCYVWTYRNTSANQDQENEMDQLVVEALENEENTSEEPPRNLNADIASYVCVLHIWLVLVCTLYTLSVSSETQYCASHNHIQYICIVHIHIHNHIPKKKNSAPDSERLRNELGMTDEQFNSLKLQQAEAMSKFDHPSSSQQQPSSSYDNLKYHAQNDGQTVDELVVTEDMRKQQQMELDRIQQSQKLKARQKLAKQDGPCLIQ
ncbi:DUF544 family protein [Reticulomyxa filosa]|uniref:DUF544 family protein n=1 Tax=Reticulomyxa filosa TaxID=46433 RepID=X6NZC0_RETFI|nr:DUF544 family protein [Reticulomyxa filosa]|eukprot:ETO31311.1 DUF544 family protein [Reticulomyxa filosa]